MGTPESDFKKKFCRELKKLGAIAILQYKQDSTTVKGFPDTICLFDGLTIFIEFKASKRAKFQPLQKEWNRRLNDAFHYAYICYPENKSEILKQIKELL